MPNGGGPSWAQEQPDFAVEIQLAVSLINDEPGIEELKQESLAKITNYWRRLWSHRNEDPKHEVNELTGRVERIKRLGGRPGDELLADLSVAQSNAEEFAELFDGAIRKTLKSDPKKLNPRIYGWQHGGADGAHEFIALLVDDYR